MLLYLLAPLRDWWFGFNVFRYITFRMAMASLTAFLITLWAAPRVIRWLTELKAGQPVRDEKEVGGLYPLHRHKAGTPTMGGLLILLSLVGSTLLWGDLLNRQVLAALGVTAALGGLGFWDDWTKLRRSTSQGVSARTKLLWQAVTAGLLMAVVLTDPWYSTFLEVPFVKGPGVDLGGWYLLLGFLVLSGSSNAVNLADGLDGLAIGCTTMIALAFTVMSYLAGHSVLADYLLISHVPGTGELAVFCAALVGAGMGFLWYNAHPACLFMGDTGSLAIGGALGTVALLIKKELLLVIVGGIFVAEALSVILQVASFRTTGRRIFRMAPLHHHFQLKGIPETQVTIRMWIVAAILALVSLSTLKLR
ncbi:MAG: phospho-N-acetylmuramoyl-pentapeptide-transferase [Candidatus Omnitrophica bacterium]|nr:phospho-N-acetylmuramoyl-pentapeptide-transferase [Candidatus Omnitrophota bacterium]